LLRNRGRTAITVTAVTLNTAVLIASLGLMEGMLDQTVDNATQMVVGEVQAHAPGYLTDRSIYKALPDARRLARIATEHGIAAAPRSFGLGLVSHGAKSAGATFWGVDPDTERRGFRLPDQVATGRFLEAARSGQVVLGRKLARALDVHVGDEVVAVVQAADGSMGNDLFHVAGVLKTVGDEVDRGALLMTAEDYDRLFVAAGRVHEVAFNSGRDGIGADAIRAVLAATPAGRAVELKTWRELTPAISDMLNLTNATIWIFGLVFVLAAGLGVLNTMLMATHDRIREYGLLKALGATPLGIVNGVLAEALLLAACATIAGAVLGVAGAMWLHRVGIDVSRLGGDGVTFAGVAFNPVMRATLRARAVLDTALVMVAACVLASIYPAVRAARLEPVAAMTNR